MSHHLNGSIFNLNDFRPIVRAWAGAQGRGEYRRISQALQMHTTLLSQILSGRKCFTEEQGFRLCSHMGLSQLETDYFLKLIQLERAGDENLKSAFRRHLKQLREQAKEVKSRVPEPKEMNEQDRAIFYSSWQYSMIRLLTSIDRFQRTEEISRHTGLSISRVKEILRFLASRGLCREERDGRYTRTDRNTHVEARSALAIRHHQNWRGKSLELHEKMTLDDFAFTAPVSLSRKDLEKVRTVLLDTLSEISRIVEDSPAEEVVYLGIDWIKM